MSDLRPGLALAALLLSAPAATAARDDAGAPHRDDAVVELRFAWPTPLRARVKYRRVRARTGGPTSTFTARYEARAVRAEDRVRVSLRGTTWSGDLPFPRALAKPAIRASEKVVQVIGPEGEFLGLEGVEAMRPVLARLFEQAKVPLEGAERAIALAEAGMRAEARDLWNVSVGFWTGASLKVGERYVLEADGEIPLLPGVRAPHSVEFGVRRRVPCAPRGKALDCVEAEIRATPDPAALERSGRAIVARLAPEAKGGEKRPDGEGLELSAESELLLVTEPGTLLPHRIVWKRSARLREGGEGPPLAEETDRNEYVYRYLPPEPARRSPPARRAPKPPATPAAVEPVSAEPSVPSAPEAAAPPESHRGDPGTLDPDVPASAGERRPSP